MTTEFEKAMARGLSEAVQVMIGAVKTASDLSAESGIDVLVGYFEEAGADAESAEIREAVKRWKARGEKAEAAP